jgi:hypothetical protein
MPFCPCCSRVGCLLDPDLCCSCVGRSGPISRRACPRTRPCHTGTRARPRLSTPAIFHPMPTAARRPAAAGYRWPAVHPVTPSARPGMTHRDEQSMRRGIKSTPAEYLRLAYGLPQAASECRCPGSGAALPNAEARNRSRAPAPARAAADSRSSRRLRPRSDGGTRWRAERQHSGRRRSARTGLASGQRPPPPVRRHPRHPESLRDLPVENPRLDQLGRR